MGTVALESKASRRPLVVWVGTWAAVALILAIVFAYTMGAPSTRSPSRTERAAAGDANEIVIAGATISGRPRAYHSKTSSSCSKFMLLPKRGKVCIEPRARAR